MNTFQRPDRIHVARQRYPRRPLAAGVIAPSFVLPRAPHGATILEDYRGQPVVLAFYVADWHPVCTAQLALYQDLLPEFERLGAVVLGISTDTLWSHTAFARVHGITFPLLSDRLPRGGVARAFGVYDSKTEASHRALVVLDHRGMIRWTALFPDEVNPGADGVLSAVEGLDVEVG